MPNLEITGFCWACGLSCSKIFCNDKCARRYKREQRAEENRVVRKGKREGYGIAGSTH